MCTLVTHSVLTEHYMFGSLSFWTAHMPFAGTCNAQNRAPTCCRAGSKHMFYNDGTIGIRRLFLCLKTGVVFICFINFPAMNSPLDKKALTY